MHIALVDGRKATLRPAADTDEAGDGIAGAMLELSTRLAGRGHEVDVFARCEEPCMHRGVRFHDREQLAAFGEIFEPDALVVVPDGLPLLFPIRARARVLWTGSSEGFALSAEWFCSPDLRPAGNTVRLYPLSLFSSSIDLVVAKSPWQRRHLAQHLSLPEDRIRVILDGVALDTFLPTDWPRDRHRIVYTSQSRHDLDLMVSLFPAIKSAVPQAELHVYSYDSAPSWLSNGAGRLPGLFWRGTVSRSVLADELRTAALIAYPATFEETLCTSVAEAQVAGLPVVCSTLGAIAERVDDGVHSMVIDDDPRSDEFAQQFVDSIVTLLQNDALRIRMSSAATAMATEQYDWEVIASQWEAELAEVASHREPRPPRSCGLNLLDSRLLRVSDRGITSQVPAELAESWLRSAWGSYGYDERIPGVPEAVDVSA
jgi:glycosyltransferase involved in cell wall biosynthesis